MPPKVFGGCEVSGGMGICFPFAGRFCTRRRSRRRRRGRGLCLGADVAFFGVGVCSLMFGGMGAGMQGEWDIVGIGELGNWGIGELGNWGFGDLGIWGFGDLGIWGFGDLGIWGFGDLGIWGFGDLGIWGFGDLGIWGFGDAPLAPEGQAAHPRVRKVSGKAGSPCSRGALGLAAEKRTGKYDAALPCGQGGAFGVRERRCLPRWGKGASG